MAQQAVPTADITDGGWLDDGGAATLFAHIVPLVPGAIDGSDDATWIQSGSAPSADPVAMHLSDPEDPAVSTGHIMRWRRGKDVAGGAAIDLTVQLRMGYTGEGDLQTEITSQTDADIPDALTTTSYTLAGGEADSITDYTDLQMRILANQP